MHDIVWQDRQVRGFDALLEQCLMERIAVGDDEPGTGEADVIHQGRTCARDPSGFSVGKFMHPVASDERDDRCAQQ